MIAHFITISPLGYGECIKEEEEQSFSKGP
jgi:hypothetical protein